MSALRPHLLWFGQTPREPTPFACKERGLILRMNPSSTTAAEYSTSCALVIALGPEPETEEGTSANVERLRTALRHGLLCVVLSPLARIPAVKQALKALVFGPQIDLWVSDREAFLPEHIARAQPGAAWSGAIAIEGEKGLCEEDSLLLRRAFCDCTSVSLVAENRGRSAQVYCVYARLRDSAAGRLPLPFFAKFDQFPKIRRELTNYRKHTTLFIPFNQRPNLDPDRCVLGAERGLIVGNFIEESESLGELVERGTARAAIHSLFGGALRGWRTQTYFDETMAVSSSIVDSLTHCVPSPYSIRRREWLSKCAKAAREIGATLTAPQLVELLKHLPPLKYRRSMTHGDLHGANVRVYRDEAILIDFASTDTGSLMADPASLDVALVMDTKKLVNEQWTAFALEAYDLANLRDLPTPRDPARVDSALWSSIRQLRQIALVDMLSDFEYAVAVAMYLLRRASYPREPDEPPGRREMAYFLVDRITKQLATELACDTAA